MQNSKELEKSKTAGVLVFAFNSTTVDYVALADQTSRLTSAQLKLPITLVTDFHATPSFKYDRVIRVESSSGNFRTAGDAIIEWKNFGRYLAYQLSPYDTTILLDGDYLTLDNSLLSLLDSTVDYRLMHNSYTPEHPSYQLMGQYGLPFVWATVVIFKKTLVSQQYFNLIGRIQNNYTYYKTLYNGSGSYRNDYAFAIANNILNGYSLNERQSIPWRMLTIEKSITALEQHGNFITVRHTDKAHVLVRQNMHVMDKAFLLSNKFVGFVDVVCDAA